MMDEPEVDLVARVGGAILLAETQWSPKSRVSKERAMALAAIEAIFAGSHMTDYRGGIVIANASYPVHFWNGTSMVEIKPAPLPPDAP